MKEFVKLEPLKRALAFRARGPDQLVLIHIARRIGDEGYSWPAIKTLVEDTGYGRKRVMKAVANLEAAGVLRVSRRHRHPNRYSLMSGPLKEKKVETAGQADWPEGEGV